MLDNIIKKYIENNYNHLIKKCHSGVAILYNHQTLYEIFEMIILVRKIFDIKDNTIIYNTIGVKEETLWSFIKDIETIEDILSTGEWRFSENQTMICFFRNLRPIIEYKFTIGKFSHTPYFPYSFYHTHYYNFTLDEKITEIFTEIIKKHVIKHVTKRNLIFDDRCLTNLKK